MILTPQEQKEQTKQAFRVSANETVDVVDIYAVPDYVSYFQGYVKLKNAFKPYKEKNYAQLQFIVESCDTNDFFPLGVRTFYRAYPTDETIEIIHKCQVRLMII